MQDLGNGSGAASSQEPPEEAILQVLKHLEVTQKSYQLRYELSCSKIERLENPEPHAALAVIYRV